LRPHSEAGILLRKREGQRVDRQWTQADHLCVGNRLLYFARELERRWRAADYDFNVFPELAANQLRLADLSGALTYDACVEWAMRAGSLPSQLDPTGRFGDVPYTVVREAHLLVQLIFWRDSFSSVHGHGFSGAFAVITGGVLQARYTFDVGERICDDVLVGELRRTDVDLLSPGCVAPIRHGSAGIHGVFHFARPTVVVVVRANHDASAERERPLQYFSPGLAYSTSGCTESSERRIQLARFLLATRGGATELVPALLRMSTPLEVVRILHEECFPSMARDAFRRLAQVAAPAIHPAVASRLDRFVANRSLESAARTLLRSVSQDDHRLLLACALFELSAAETRRLVEEWPRPSREPFALVDALVALAHACLDRSVKSDALARYVFAQRIVGTPAPQIAARISTKHGVALADVTLAVDRLLASPDSHMIRSLSVFAESLLHTSAQHIQTAQPESTERKR
jgi:hypothetical protein